MRLRFCSMKIMSAFFRSQKCDLRLLLVSRSQLVKVPQNSENRRAYCCDAREEEEEEEEEEDILSQQHQQNNKKKDIEEEEKITHTKKDNPFFETLKKTHTHTTCLEENSFLFCFLTREKRSHHSSSTSSFLSSKNVSSSSLKWGRLGRKNR